MKKSILLNDLTVITEKKSSDSVSILVNVCIGSNYETKKQLGISHFIEHMLFEGTKKRRKNSIIANEIERLGGELNAFTSNERTVFYVKVPKKHFDIALDIISDIIQNPLFEKKSIEKERKIILKEINMVTDEPRFHQWVLFNKALFKKHPARNPPYGTKETVSSMKKQDLINYYKKYYTSNNTIISVVGNISNTETKIKKAFKKLRKASIKPLKVIEPVQTTIQTLKEKKRILNSYMVLGYKTPTRNTRDSYTLDIIKALLARGQSGKIVEEIRGRLGLAYEVNVLHEPNKDYGSFAVYLNTDKKNIPKIKKLILAQFKSIASISTKDLNDAKGYIEGKYLLENEDTQSLADEFAYWEMISSAKLAKNYLREIRKIAKDDIARVANKYLTKNYAIAVIEQSN